MHKLNHVCQLLRAAKLRQTSLFRDLFFGFFCRTSVLASPALSGQLLSQKITLPTAKNQVHATALTDIAINLLKLPKTSKYLFEIFQKIQRF